MSHRTRFPILVALGGLLATCGGEPPASEPAETPAAQAVAAAPSLEAATALGVRNAREPIPGLVTGGQPSQEQLEGLAAAGYRNFISLRPVSEDGAGWEEAYASTADRRFARIEIAGGADLTRENVEALAAILDEAGDEPTVLYCASGNRVGAMLALKARWIDGASPEEALALGQAAGMTRLESRVREMLGLEPGA